MGTKISIFLEGHRFLKFTKNCLKGEDLQSATLTTFLEPSEENKTFRCTLPTVRKSYFAGAVYFEHFCFSKPLRFFLASSSRTFFSSEISGSPEVFNLVPWESTAEHNFSKVFSKGSLQSEIATTSTVLA